MLGGGANLLGYYMYHGGINPEGKMCIRDSCGGNAGQSAQSSAGTAESGQAETGNTAASTDGISADSPYADKGLDLSEPVTVIMYALGDRPEDMDKVLEELNSKYLNPWLNTTLEMQFLNWSDYTTKYSLVLAGSEPVDLMYTSSWCYYNDEAAKGAFREPVSYTHLDVYKRQAPCSGTAAQARIV